MSWDSGAAHHTSHQAHRTRLTNILARTPYVLLLHVWEAYGQPSGNSQKLYWCVGGRCCTTQSDRPSSGRAVCLPGSSEGEVEGHPLDLKCDVGIGHLLGAHILVHVLQYPSSTCSLAAVALTAAFMSERILASADHGHKANCLAAASGPAGTTFCRCVRPASQHQG